MKVIGLTGGIGSGKTTISQIFENLGIPVYYADLQAKKLLNKNQGLKKKVKQLLGEKAYFANGKLNREYISNMIFSDKDLLAQMNSIVHPLVRDDVQRWAEGFKSVKPYVLQEAALLVENSSYRSLDGLIVVTCPEAIRIQRVVKRDKTSKEIVMKRIKNQLPEEFKTKVADYIIENDGTKLLIPQVWQIHQLLTKHK